MEDIPDKDIMLFTCMTKGIESHYVWDSDIAYRLEYSGRLFSLLYVAVV